MAEIEKKYSDYQVSECDTQEAVEPIDERLCPTCQPNPDWKLPSAHWSDIEEAYLNESVCEYHVRVYAKEVGPSNVSEKDILNLGVERILVDLDKPLNNGTRQQLLNAAFVVDTFRSLESQQLGVAYLVGVPAFNMDQIESNDSDNAEESFSEPSRSGEFTVDINGLGKKLRQLRIALRTYGIYYASATKVGAGFVIRQEADETQRINYKDAASKLRQFQNKLGDRLTNKGYPRIGRPGLFKKKSAKRIKFVFKNNNKPYDLKAVYVLDAECDKYLKIPVPKGHILRKPSMRVVYHFLENLDKVINDITARETKPWLDFTLQHFYPRYIVDYGNISSIDDTRAGLECLLEMELGIGNGQVIDSLTKEIVSAFDSIEKQIAEQACRSLTEQASGGATALAEKNANQGQVPSEEAKAAMISRYEKEFENKFYKGHSDKINGEFKGAIKILNETLSGVGGITTNPVTVKNFFQKLKQSNLGKIRYVSPTYSFKNPEGVKIISNEGVEFDIYTSEDLERNKKQFAENKFKNLQQGSFGNQIQNSPHFQEAMTAANEVIENFDNTYVAPIKAALNGASNFELEDIIPTIGLCGMSKLAGKALNCIANGITFDDFLDTLIDKSIDFMEVNTIDLFLNGLPITFRTELKEALEKEFGRGVDISSLIGIKQAEDGGQKIKDFVKSKQLSKRIQDIYEAKYTPAGVSAFHSSLTDEERRFISDTIGPFTQSGTFIQNAWSIIYDEMTKLIWNNEYATYLIDDDGEGYIYRRKPGSESETENKYKPKKYILLWIKHLAREHRKSLSSFRQAVNRISLAVTGLAADTSDAAQNSAQFIEEAVLERSSLRRQIADFDDLIEKEKQTIKSIFTGTVFNETGNIDNLAINSASKRELLQKSSDRIADYKSIQRDLINSLDDIDDEIKDELKNDLLEEIQQLRDRARFLTSQVSEDLGRQIVDSLISAQGAFDRAKATIQEAAFETLDSLIITGNEEDELNNFEQAAKSFQETALGVKVDVVFDVVFDFVLETIMDYFSPDELFDRLRSYPAIDYAIDKVEELLLKPCPIAPVFYPPPSDFMKSLSVDVCDPTVSLTLPKLVVPNINFRFNIEYQFNEFFREAIIKVVSNLAINLLTRLMSTLESSLCNLVEASGGLVADALRGNLKDSFYRALNEAFCNDGDDPVTSQAKAEQLAEALFAPLSFNADEDYSGAGAKVSNIISSVASTKEFLEAMVARDGEENDQFNRRIANSITVLAPEMEVLLGDPNQVAYFFRSLGSFLSPDDRERIRDLLSAGVPNLPISQAICLTNDQLNEWNDLRERLLEEEFDITMDGSEGIVKKLNDATLEAFIDLVDDVAALDDTDGPFIGAATNEVLKDVCNKNNLFNDVSQNEIDREVEEELIDNFFNNISRSLALGFMSRGGLLAEAMRDVENRREFGRSIQKLFRLNYGNSQEEQDLKFENAGRITRFIMNLGEDDDGDGVPDVIGRYPNTVAIKQRKEILEDGGIVFDFDRVKNGKASSRNVVYRYTDSDDDFSFKQKIAASNLRKPKKTFGYNLQVTENIDEEGPQVELNMNIPVPISDSEDTYLQSVGFQYKANNKKDIRKAAFQKILRNKIPFQKNFGELYENIFETANINIVEALLTNYEASDELPIGYKFGYVNDELTKDSFEYTPSETEGELGTFADPRIIPLDPKLYGGRYSNPPYYVEPRKFTGWLELATSAFESQEGCDPKTPPLISFSDIKQRTKNLSNSMRNDPRLSLAPECVSVKPFHLLLDNKNKAKLDGVIRTTIRTYLAEFFIKGYGLFSNLQIRPENFDASMMTYIVKKMKSEMEDLGTRTSNRKIKIVRERYWYTFLEQCVEAYQRTIDVDNVKPPEPVMAALNRIQLGLDKFRVVDKKLKKKTRKELKDLTLRRPKPDYDPIDEINKGAVYNLAMSVAFRLTPEDEREGFFDGGVDESVNALKIRFASIKKLKFFQKIYFIKLFEREATLIMSELIKDELSRLSKLITDGPTDKPYYFDLYKSFFGMKSFFPKSTSRIGLNDYYLKKQAGRINTGTIPTIKSNNLKAPSSATSEAQFVVESYVRLVEKDGINIPNFIRTRPTKYRGAVSLEDMSQFIDQNLDRLEDKYLSDYFGDLSFTYTAPISTLLEKGFTTEASKRRLIELNPDKEEAIKAAYRQFVFGNSTLQENVTYDETFLLEGETPNPTGTIGSTGVRYGLRVSIILPKETFSRDEKDRLKEDPVFSNLSKEEKAYLFEDGVVMLPVATQEIDLVDAKFEDFDPFSGTEPYDLECLINKITTNPEFTTMFDKLLNFRQASSMLAVYCMETLPAAIGRDESERTELDGNPDVDEWDRTVNKFGKNFLRKEFKGLYLSNTEDGLSTDDDDDESLGNMIRLNNPFDFLSLPSVRLPWWLRRRMKTKVFDANGQECADPEKDLL